MRVPAALLIAAVSFAGARVARHAVSGGSDDDTLEAPYTPSVPAAPFVSLGYREALADFLYVRMRIYYGSYYGTTGPDVAALAEAIVALDPSFYRVYEFGANGMTIAQNGVDQSIYLRAVALLERGIARFPTDWSMPLLAGEIYLQDLKTNDPALRRVWDERGVALVESSVRKPGAPQEAAIWAAHIRTKLGEHERAATGLKELLLTTHDMKLRKAMLERLAKLESGDQAEIAAEIFSERKRFEKEWLGARPSVTATNYVVIGPRLAPAFDMTDLATGGHDLVGAEVFERLEPLE